MKDILVLGMGKVGSLVGTLLSKKFNVIGVDQKKPHYNYKLPFKVIPEDVGNLKKMKSIFEKHDAVVSALPFFLNKKGTMSLLAHLCRSFFFISNLTNVMSSLPSFL